MSWKDDFRIVFEILTKLAVVGLVIISISLFIFMMMSFLLGGSALVEMSGNGTFYIGGHGQAKEVSWIAFEYSRIHAIIVRKSAPYLFILIPIALLNKDFRQWFGSGNQNSRNNNPFNQ